MPNFEKYLKLCKFPNKVKQLSVGYTMPGKMISIFDAHINCSTKLRYKTYL